jgi:hypothetical protein
MPQNRLAGLIWGISFCLVILIVNALTMGAPGFFLFALGDSLAETLLDSTALGHLNGDNIWPISFLMGFAWPIGGVIIWMAMLTHQAERLRPIKKWIIFLSILLIWDVVLSVYFHLKAPW